MGLWGFVTEKRFARSSFPYPFRILNSPCNLSTTDSLERSLFEPVCFLDEVWFYLNVSVRELLCLKSSPKSYLCSSASMKSPIVYPISLIADIPLYVPHHQKLSFNTYKVLSGYYYYCDDNRWDLSLPNPDSTSIWLALSKL